MTHESRYLRGEQEGGGLLDEVSLARELLGRGGVLDAGGVHVGVEAHVELRLLEGRHGARRRRHHRAGPLAR